MWWDGGKEVNGLSRSERLMLSKKTRQRLMRLCGSCINRGVFYHHWSGSIGRVGYSDLSRNRWFVQCGYDGGWRCNRGSAFGNDVVRESIAYMEVSSANRHGGSRCASQSRARSDCRNGRPLSPSLDSYAKRGWLFIGLQARCI